MKTITIQDLRDLDPCYDPTKYLPEDWKGNLIDILDVKDCPVKDRLWVVLRKEFIDEKTLHLLACDFAENVLPIWYKYAAKNKYYNAPAWAIEVKRRWVNGYASTSSLAEAAETAVEASWAAEEEAEEASWAGAAAEAAAASRAVEAAEAAASRAVEASWAVEAAAARAVEASWAASRAVEAAASRAVEAAASRAAELAEAEENQIEIVKNLLRRGAK